MPQPKHRGEYPRDWPAIARSVKDEAKWCCERCGEPHSPKTGRTLTVHNFDGDKSNCSRANLMPLCQACHLSVQARVDPEVPLLFLPSTWALPYVAAFYESRRGNPGPLYESGRGNQGPLYESGSGNPGTLYESGSGNPGTLYESGSGNPGTLYESGSGNPGTLYDLGAWRSKYELEAKRAWPDWAKDRKAKTPRSDS